MQADSAQQQGLYRPEFDHDACGIGALADINGERHHQILDDALSILVNLEHRGGTGLEKNTGDGAGILIQIPDTLYRDEFAQHGITFSAKRLKSAARFCRQRATMAWPCCSSRRTTRA